MTNNERLLYSNPFSIANHARTMMVEQIMTLIGRSSSNPKRYREILEGFDSTTLQRSLEALTLGEIVAGDFPDPSLTENAGVIASTDTGHAPGSARDALQRVTTPQHSTVELSTSAQ